MDKSSAYGAKEPGFKNQVEEENLFVSLCINMFCKKDRNKQKSSDWGQPLKKIKIINNK